MTKKISTKKRTTKKKHRSKKKSTSRSSTKSPIEQLSTQEIQLHLRKRDRRLKTLKRKRERLSEQLGELDREITQLGGQTQGAGGKRPRNEKNLGDALVDVLRGKEMSVTEAANAVQQAGYVSTASNFRSIVNQRLITDKRIKKVSRGVYTA